jgi:hypothetical protein
MPGRRDKNGIDVGPFWGEHRKSSVVHSTHSCAKRTDSTQHEHNALRNPVHVALLISIRDGAHLNFEAQGGYGSSGAQGLYDTGEQADFTCTSQKLVYGGSIVRLVHHSEWTSRFRESRRQLEAHVSNSPQEDAFGDALALVCCFSEHLGGRTPLKHVSRHENIDSGFNIDEWAVLIVHELSVRFGVRAHEVL